MLTVSKDNHYLKNGHPEGQPFSQCRPVSRPQGLKHLVDIGLGIQLEGELDHVAVDLALCDSTVRAGLLTTAFPF